MLKLSLVILVMLFHQVVFSQLMPDSLNIQLQTSVFISDKAGQPSWLHSNQLGRVHEEENLQGIMELFVDHFHLIDSSNKISLAYGANLVGWQGDKTNIYLQQYWAVFKFKNWYIHSGAKSEPIFADELSMTNGNLFLSNNARPMPRIEFGVTDFNPIRADILKRFSLDFLFAEYFLLDDRHVSNAHLHHKKLQLNYSIANNWSFSIGLDHWVFWGGNSPDYGNLPGFEYYFRYILASSGGEESPENDKLNASGNHLGQYQFSFNHESSAFNLDLYWQHPWEDDSGVKMKNIEDGLWGVAFLKKNQHAYLKGLVLEFVNTRNQSRRYNQPRPDPDRPGYMIAARKDNYFNNSVYRSGYVNYGRMIGFPLLRPTINANNVSKGFENNRIWAIHAGASGRITGDFYWKSMLTYSRNYGKYDSPYIPPRDLFAAGINLSWVRPYKPVNYCLRFAFDRGDYLQKTNGLEFQVSYKLK